MPDGMKPDMRTWVEAAIARHLRDQMPLDRTHAYLVRSALGQLLRYWRYDVPGDWGDLLDNVTYGIIAWQIKERAALAVGGRHVDAYVPDVLAAIRKKDDWQSLASLPDPVWGWVRELTGLTREEWQEVPRMAAELLDSKVECPRCKSYRTLRESVRIREDSDPLALSSTGAVRFTCSRCMSGLSIDLLDTRIPREMGRPRRARRSPASVLFFVGLAAVIIYLIFRSLL